ncbi:MAG: NifU family protein [Planctomycetota bacterium]
MASIDIRIDPTPNPNVLKFSWGATVAEGGPYEFDGEKSAAHSPLAKRIFACNGVLGAFIARDFISVRKHEGVSWDRLQGAVEEAIRDWSTSGDEAVGPDPDADAKAADEADVATRIREVLDRDIRPAVAMDGGDIVLVGFEKGVVTVELRGACHGCPSSTATLKMGVERRLMATVPEVRQVVAVGL